MRTRELRNKQKVFNEAAKFLLFATEEERTTKALMLEGRVCALGNLVASPSDRLQSQKGNLSAERSEAMIQKMKEIDLSLRNEIINVNDFVKRSRQPQALRAAAKRLGLEIPDFLEKSRYGR
jgi:hypothetical protein